MSLDQLISSESEPSPPAKRSYAWLLPLFLLLGFTVVILLLFGKRLLPATSVETTPVLTLRAAESDSNVIPSANSDTLLFQASGWIEPAPYTIYVPSLINGVVDTVHVLEGQSVKQGQLLATLIDDDARLNLRSAKTKIKSLKARINAHCQSIVISQREIDAAEQKVSAQKSLYQDASDEFNRLTGLARGVASERQIAQARLSQSRQLALLDQAKTEAPRLEAQIAQIHLERTTMEAELAELEVAREQAQLALDRTRIHSPSDGAVLHLHVAPGKKRMLDMDDPDSAVIVSLYSPQSLQARVDVPLAEAAKLKVGQRVSLTTDLLPERTFSGVVSRLSGEADIQRNSLQAKVAILDPDPRLRPEMLVRAKFFPAQQTNSTQQVSTSSSGRLALYVDSQSLIDDSSVWVVSPDMTAELRNIELSNEKRDGHRRVLSGLKSGERTILPPHQGLKSGSRLRVTENKH